MTTALKNPPPPAADQLSDPEFDAIRRLVQSKFGINLAPHKKPLVVGRLQKVLRQRNLKSFHDYYQWLISDTSGEAMNELADRISTNHTFFHREKSHFEFFTERFLPEMEARHQQLRDNDLRIWCAGCATGEEPYTLVMLMMEFFGPRFCDWNPTLLATDISTAALETAMAGTYTADRVAELPPNLRHNYLLQNREGNYQVIESVREKVHFREHNLMDQNFPFKKQFDAIFCRNVMIYFDRKTRQALVAKFHQHTAPHGYLFIGHAETVDRDGSGFHYLMPAVYRK